MKLSKSTLLLIAYALSGVAALVYELGWMRELSAMLGATAYAAGTMLGAYMTGLGIGALAGIWLASRVKRALWTAALVELAIAGFSILAFLGIRFIPPWYFDRMRIAGTGSPVEFLTLQFAVCFIVMMLPTIAMGMTYPLIIKGVGRTDRMGAISGRLYAINTAGAIVGSLAATFAFLPLVGVKGSLFIAAAFSIIAAWMMASVSEKEIDWLAFLRRPAIPAVALVILVIIALIPGRVGSPLGLGQAFYYRSAANFEKSAGERITLFDREGIYSRVQVTQNPDGSKTLSNGALDEGTDNNYDRVTTAMLAAVPAESVQEGPRGSACIVGLGTGFTSQTYYNLGFERVVTVEINPDVVPASEFFLGDHSFDGERWKLVVDDARAYLLTSEETFDCITSEPSWPWSSGVAALFTQEFMEIAESRLNPSGAYCQWLPNYLLNPEDVAMMYKTMSQVFDRVDVWSINFPDSPDAELLLVGHAAETGSGTAPVTQEESKERLDALIQSGAFGDNELIVPDCITPYPNVAMLEAAVTDPAVPLNTDDHSLLEYRVFWNYLQRAFRPRGFGSGSVLEQ